MPDLAEVSKGIEGKKIGGQSRIPLKPHGLVKVNGKNCFRYKAKFDVKAEIIKKLGGNTFRINRNLSIDQNDRLNCDQAVIHTLKDNYSNKVKRGSATHQANHWKFPKQTAVEITRPHEELHNAISKKKQLHKSLKSELAGNIE